MRVLIAVNEKAGGGDGGLYDFIRLLSIDGAEVVVRSSGDDRRIEDLVADHKTFDRVVAAGGDGTVSAVSYSMRDSGVPILVYPAGTANLLAQNLGIPLEPHAIADVIRDGLAVGFDLGELQAERDGGRAKRGFAIMAGAGYDATIMEAADPLKATLGSAAYLLAAVSNPVPTMARFDLTLDGESFTTEGIAVLLVNFARIQFDLPVTPNSDPRDGLLDVAVIRTRTAVGLLPAVAAAVLDKVRDHPDRSPSMDLYTASSIEIASEPALQVQADGDPSDTRTPISATVLPQAATFLVPTDSRFADASS